MAVKQVGTPGRYDAIAEKALLEAGADMVVLLVINGRHGMGLSVPCTLRGLAGQALLPALLRSIADDIEASQGPSGVRITTEGVGES